ncbi:MAG: hypothetical protein QOF78_2397 [Phycisphaerales bacterium]|jgi:hypothetical protein|nr:hypothetical protein [Phycisphaerales bacterium]
MKKLRPPAILFGVLATAAGGTAAAQTTQLPSTVYIWPMSQNYNAPFGSPPAQSQHVMMASLAGIVNRSTNGEVLLSPDSGTQPNPRFWLDQLKASYPSVTSQVQTHPGWFIDRYKSKLSGYVLFDPANPHSINVATSIAGVTDAIVVSTATAGFLGKSTKDLAVEKGLIQIADARTMTYADAYAQYGPQFNRNMLFHQDTWFDHQLRDFAVMNRGFTYFTDPTALAPYTTNQNAQGRIFGWGNNEFDLFNQASQSNQQVVASNHNWSSSTTARWKVPIEKQKQHTPGSVTTKTGKHYVALVMSDGDNPTWLTNGMGTDPKYFGSPHRGKFDMTWDFTPSLKDMNPVAHNFFYNNAADGSAGGRDTFVAAGGSGIAFPSQTPDINGLAESIAQSMAAADLKVTSILDNSYIVSNKLEVILGKEPVVGMMYKTYDTFYKGRNGALTWRNGKPILSVKYSLWDGADSAASIAAALNSTANVDPIDNQASYSIVNVHPWSTAGPDGTGAGDPMSNVWQLVQWLDANKVEVVGMEELFVHLRNHFGTPLPGAVVNATWTRNASSNWGTTRTNWTGAMPNFPDATVNFGNAITAARTVTVSAAVSAGAINFNSSFSYTIAGASAVTLDTTTGAAASITVASGNHTISAPLVLADDVNVTVASATNVLTMTSLQPTSKSIGKSGAGALAVNNVRADRLTITGGEVRIAANGTNTGTSKLSELSIAGAGGGAGGMRLDLADNKLILTSMPLEAVESLIRSGHNGGGWDGGGIATRRSDALSGLTTLAVSTALETTFDNFGGLSVAGGDVLVMYTYAGDANLDGFISGDDYSTIDFNVGTSADGYSNGDFNYDGIISGDDYSTIDFNIVAQGAPFPVTSAPAAASVTPVPEPAACAFAFLAVAHLSRRSRRR